MSGTHGVFQHRTGYFYTVLEEDFCEVYRASGKNEVCRAYITSILEHLTNKQYDTTGSDADIWVFMSLPEMARRMRHAFGERTIHKEIQGMIADGFLFKRRATGKATMEYRLNLKKLRKALEALPERQSCNSATYDLANLQDQSGKNARLTLQNYKNDLAELQPRITLEETIEETENKVGTYGANAPTPAHLLKEVDEKLEEVEEKLEHITGEHPAVQPTNETPYHIASDLAIGNEEEELVLAVPGMLRLPSKTSSQQAPGTAALPPAAAVTDTVGRLTGISSDQAISAPLVPLPAQAASPPVGSMEPTPTAQVSGRRSPAPPRPRQQRPPTMPEPPKTVTLTPQEQAFWGLWCNVWFNKEVQPDLTPTAYSHVKRLCPYIVSAELLNSLIDYARKDLQEAKGIKRKAVQLGNLVNCYRGWKQEQAAQGPPLKKEGTDFDIYKGNGPEEREQALRDYEQHKADGTLIW